MTDVVVHGLSRETVVTSDGVLNVRGLAREIVVLPGAGTHDLIVRGLVREVVALPGATVGGPKQYAVTVVT